MITESEYSQLISNLYAFVDDADALPTFQNFLCRLLNGSNSSFCVIDRSIGHLSYIANSVPETAVANYLQSIDEDPWFLAAIHQTKTPSGMLGSELIPQREYRKSRVYTDCNRPFDVEYLVACGSNPGNEFSAFLTVNRTKSARDFDSHDKYVLNLLADHVLRTARLSMDQKSGIATGYTGAKITLDRFGLVDINQSAMEILSSTKLLRIHRRQLEILDPAVQARFKQIVGQLRRGNLSVNCGLTCPLNICDESEQLSMFLIPGSRISPNFVRERLVTVMLVSNRMHWWDEVSQAYSLTPAEIRLVRELVAGKSLKDYAETAGRSVNTMKTHLKSVMRKLGVNSQLQLAMKVMGHS